MAYLASDIRTLVVGDAWHGPSWDDILRGLTLEQATLRVIPGVHTIYDLVHHTGAWAAEVARRLRGASAAMPAEGDYPPPDARPNDADWRSAVTRLHQAHDDLLDAIGRLEPSRLDDRVGATRDAPLGSGVTFRATIAGVLAHTAYHAGQAMLLRRAMEQRAPASA